MSRSFKVPDIYNYLDISTGHLSPDDVKSLDNDAECTSSSPCDPTLIVFKYDEGWFVVVPSDDGEFKEAYSDQLALILKEARENDCCFVRFDADGNKYTDDLEVFAWP